MIRTLLSVLFLVALAYSVTAATAVATPIPADAKIVETLNKRTELLQKFSSMRDKGDCNTGGATIGITLKYGREGNLWMQYLNLIWLGKYLNRTAVVNPGDKIFKQFDMKYFESTFCTARRANRAPGKHVDVRASEIHGMHHIYKKYGQKLPLQNATEGQEHAADDTLFFFASIYAGLKQPFVDMLASFLTRNLQASLNYVAIQRRNYEGACFWIVYHHCRYADFSSKHFDMTTSEWKEFNALDRSVEEIRNNYSYWKPGGVVLEGTPLPTYHPLCNMTLDVVQGAVRTQLGDVAELTENGIPLQYFIMTDGQQPITKDVTAALRPIQYSGGEASLMDRLIATHSRLFIRNTASSFSLSSEVLRRIFSLPVSGMSDDAAADFFFPEWFSFHTFYKVGERRKKQFAAFLATDNQITSGNFTGKS